MTEEEMLDAVGKFVASNVRDAAYASINHSIDARRGLVVERLSLDDETQYETIRRAALTIIDLVLDQLLTALESTPGIPVALCVDSGDGSSVNVVNISDGLAGELYGDRGWLTRFSSNSGGLE